MDLNSGWFGDCLLCQFSYLPGVLSRLAMRHTRVFGVGIPNFAYGLFKHLVLALP